MREEFFLNLFGRQKGGGMSLCLAWEEARAHWVICPVSQLHELKSQVRFNASFLRPRTKSSLFPSETYLRRAAQLPVRYSPADVPWETRLAVLPSPRVQEWALCTVGLKMTHSLLLIPIGVPKWTKLPAKRRGCGQWMCV